MQYKNAASWHSLPQSFSSWRFLQRSVATFSCLQDLGGWIQQLMKARIFYSCKQQHFWCIDICSVQISSRWRPPFFLHNPTAEIVSAIPWTGIILLKCAVQFYAAKQHSAWLDIIHLECGNCFTASLVSLAKSACCRWEHLRRCALFILLWFIAAFQCRSQRSFLQKLSRIIVKQLYRLLFRYALSFFFIDFCVNSASVSHAFETGKW